MKPILSLKNSLRPAKNLLDPLKKTPSLKVALAGAVLITISTTAAIVYFPWLLVSQRNVDMLIAQTNKEIALATSQEVERLFSSAQSAQGLIQSSYINNFVNLSDQKAQEAFLLSALQANPDFTWVQFGYANGNFLGAQRMPEGILKFHSRDWNSKNQTTTTTIHAYRRVNQQFKQIDSQSMPMNPAFYAPQRPWYQAALKTPGQPAWSIYVYRSTNAPGMDATVSIEQQGKTVGVVGVGIELKQLSEYLKRLRGQRPGAAFIINTKGELIASTEPQDVISLSTTNQDQPQLQKFSQTRNPLLQYASDTLQTQGQAIARLQSLQKFTYVQPETGDRYFISLAPLGHLDWQMGTVIPESIYLKEINQNKQILLIVIIAFVITTSGLAVLLTDRIIARPILRVARAAAAIETQKFEVESLSPVAQRTDELGQLARVFQTMARQIYVREQRLKQQVQDLRIEIDEVKRQKQVQEIVETDFFQDLVSKAHTLRKRSQTKSTKE
ncbi:MAG: HAMP domain-containing protein [Drouetiella hepatica Uher 2000/2452]|jgi:HAMP domain-containing protein|uniref:HAMP domain-containing protein n=1 Tax=Drouetiella hepatica Uher 2000/2452 TaxID=904376 RepID=A0A951QD83_9CYAN|nr:HAMP domain-containing protein [Drouetiella hepatica Uher 2000/2452]